MAALTLTLDEVHNSGDLIQQIVNFDGAAVTTGTIPVRMKNVLAVTTQVTDSTTEADGIVITETFPNSALTSDLITLTFVSGAKGSVVILGH